MMRLPVHALLASLLLTPLVAGCDAVQAISPASADSPRAAAPPAGFNPQASLAPLVEAVQPAVVNVYVRSRKAIPREYQFFFGMPSERVVQGQGSGFVVSADGYIVTNHHVVEEATDIQVKFTDGQERAAKVVGADPASDVALLKIDAGGKLAHLQLGDSDALRVGDWVIAVGNPLGLGHTVTAGIVSGKGRNIPDMPFEEFLQTDASINPGNSGGPLVGLDGRVVGMNTAIIQGANSVGFAIPASHLSSVIADLRSDGKVVRGYLGVQMATLPAAAREAIGDGVLLADVVPDGAAEKAGLQRGDVVVEVAGKPVKEPQDLQRVIGTRKPGQEVVVGILRRGKAMTITVKLMERPSAP